MSLGSPFRTSTEVQRVDKKIQAMKKRDEAEARNPKKVVIGRRKKRPPLPGRFNRTHV